MTRRLMDISYVLRSVEKADAAGIELPKMTSWKRFSEQ